MQSIIYPAREQKALDAVPTGLADHGNCHCPVQKPLKKNCQCKTSTFTVNLLERSTAEDFKLLHRVHVEGKQDELPAPLSTIPNGDNHKDNANNFRYMKSSNSVNHQAKIST